MNPNFFKRIVIIGGLILIVFGIFSLLVRNYTLRNDLRLDDSYESIEIK